MSICYECGKNNNRNSVTTSIHRDLVELTHPISGNDGCIEQIHKNVVRIESAIFNKYND